MTNPTVTRREYFNCCYMYFESTPEFQIHRYCIDVTVASSLGSDVDTVMSFHELSKFIRKHLPNNKFIYNQDSIEFYSRTITQSLSSVPVQATFSIPYNVTAENLARIIGYELQEDFDYNKLNIKVEKITLREDNDSLVTWIPSNN